MSGTTPVMSTKMDAGEVNSLDREKQSRSVRSMETLCLFGESLLMTVDSGALTAPSFTTKDRSSHRSLSDRLTPWLISAGLVKGIIPTSIRRSCREQRILDSVFSELGGERAEEPKVDC
jgi:hypothetical protein